MHADLRQVIYALSDALDLVGVDDIAHGKRVGIMAAECGRSMNLSDKQITMFFELGLLHDIGVSSTRVHSRLVAEFDWGGFQEHAETGYLLLKNFAPLAHLALPIRYHHTRWQQLQSDNIDPQIAETANLIMLVDRVDALAASYYNSRTVLAHTETIREAIRSRSGTYFAPHLVEAYLNASRTEAFWLHLEPRAIQSYMKTRAQQAQSIDATVEDLLNLARIFAQIVDAKSPFTAVHSLGVSRISKFIAKKMGCTAATCIKIEIAGLLHDLGKLRVPDEILDKPGPLDHEERLSLNTHSFETYQILSSIQGFEDIACWAAYHHEEPDGSGYPFHLTEAKMMLEAKIIRVADIFQAMAQDRPYRRGLTAEGVMHCIDKLCRQGRLDKEIVAVVGRNLDQAMRAAILQPDQIENEETYQAA